MGDDDLQSAPEIVNFAGGGVVTDGGLTAVGVDATGFAAQGTFISDLTDSVFNSIDNGGTVHGNGADLLDAQGFGGIGQEEESGDIHLWGSIFGGYHDVEGDSNLVQFDHRFRGILSGIENGDAAGDGVLGLFGGYSESDLTVALNASDTETEAFFGGAYWKKDYGSHRIHAAFVAGATDNETERLVNGTVLRGNYDGFFYSPSLTISAPVDLFETPSYISGRVSYVNLQLDGYTESGTLAPLTVSDRDISVVNLRGQLNLPQVKEQSDGGKTHFNLAVGVDATFDAGSDAVSAAVAATPFSFSADTQEQVAGFVGVNIDHVSADGRYTLGLNGELQSDFNDGVEATGELRISMKY